MVTGGSCGARPPSCSVVRVAPARRCGFAGAGPAAVALSVSPFLLWVGVPPRPWGGGGPRLWLPSWGGCGGGGGGAAPPPALGPVREGGGGGGGGGLRSPGDASCRPRGGGAAWRSRPREPAIGQGGHALLPPPSTESQILMQSLSGAPHPPAVVARRWLAGGGREGQRSVVRGLRGSRFPPALVVSALPPAGAGAPLSLGRQLSGRHWCRAVHGGRGPPYHSGSRPPGFSGHDLRGVPVRRRGPTCSSRPPSEPAAGAGGRVTLRLPPRAGGVHPFCLRGWGPGPPRLAGRWGCGGGGCRAAASLLSFQAAACGTPSWLSPCRRRAPCRRARAVGAEVPPPGGGGEGRPVDRPLGGPI